MQKSNAPEKSGSENWSEVEDYKTWDAIISNIRFIKRTSVHGPWNVFTAEEYFDKTGHMIRKLNEEAYELADAFAEFYALSRIEHPTIELTEWYLASRSHFIKELLDVIFYAVGVCEVTEQMVLDARTQKPGVRTLYRQLLELFIEEQTIRAAEVVASDEIVEDSPLTPYGHFNAALEHLDASKDSTLCDSDYEQLFIRICEMAPVPEIESVQSRMDRDTFEIKFCTKCFRPFMLPTRSNGRGMCYSCSPARYKTVAPPKSAVAEEKLAPKHEHEKGQFTQFGTCKGCGKQDHLDCYSYCPPCRTRKEEELRQGR